MLWNMSLIDSSHQSAWRKPATLPRYLTKVRILNHSQNYDHVKNVLLPAEDFFAHTVYDRYDTTIIARGNLIELEEMQTESDGSLQPSACL